MTAYPLTRMQAHRLEIHDAKIRRCWWCGAWCYDLRDCAACTAPVEREVAA